MEDEKLPDLAEHFTDFKEAVLYLCGLPVFKGEDGEQLFDLCLDTAFVFFDPRTGDPDEEDDSKNTELRVELRCGPWNPADSLDEKAREYFPDGAHGHNLDWDCSGKTFEEAFLKLANLVHRDYGDESQFV